MAPHIHVSTDLAPNLIMHIMACSGVAGRKDYGKKYHQTIRSEEKLKIKRFMKDFECKPPLAGGPFFTILFQIPSYLEAANVIEISKLFHSLKRCLQSGSFDVLKETFSKEMMFLDIWLPPSLQASLFDRFKSQPTDVKSVIDQFTDILNAVYERFYKSYWSITRGKILKKALTIERGLSNFRLLDRWEGILGKDFPYPEFKVYLCEPCSSISSLMAEKIVIPAVLTFDQALQVIIHEAGVHFITPSEWLQNPKTSRAFKKDMEGLIRVEEAAICYLKPYIFRKIGMEMREDVFLKGMKLEKELAAFSDVWRKQKVRGICEAVAIAYSKLRFSF
jgi:hypothetical protein